MFGLNSCTFAGKVFYKDLKLTSGGKEHLRLGINVPSRKIKGDDGKERTQYSGVFVEIWGGMARIQNEKIEVGQHIAVTAKYYSNKKDDKTYTGFTVEDVDSVGEDEGAPRGRSQDNEPDSADDFDNNFPF